MDFLAGLVTVLRHAVAGILLLRRNTAVYLIILGFVGRNAGLLFNRRLSVKILMHRGCVLICSILCRRILNFSWLLGVQFFSELFYKLRFIKGGRGMNSFFLCQNS